MNKKVISYAIGNISNRHIEEAADFQVRKKEPVWIKWGCIAACLAVVIFATFSILPNYLSQQGFTPQNNPNGVIDHNPPIITTPDDQSDNTEQVINLNINEIAVPNAVSSNIALVADDYTAMSYEELLTYFDVSLPITETLPCLTLQSKYFGVFKSEDRGIYYDGNSVVFRNTDGTQSLNIVLSKVFKHTYDIFDLSEEELKFTDINGRELAVFHYKNENGAECYYAEFLQDDVAFIISSENISAKDYAKCLQALVNKTQQSSNSVHTITGEIVAIDPYANHIGIRLDEDKAPQYSRGYGIALPDGKSADGYSLGDRVEITYTGEPATILTIWAEQLVDITLLP